MNLYIIYIEPLLLYLEKTLLGLRSFSFSQLVEAYCDDVNVLTDSEEDLLTVDLVVSKFEKLSGAILSRNNKCKIMGLGRWKGKQDWPLNYVKTEEELKIFGIILKESYRDMVKTNWIYRYDKFDRCLMSWATRNLPSLTSRVEVVRLYALSRIYYVASILPINKTMVKKIEGLTGKFVWKGWLLRVSIEEAKNPTSKGGLNLVCVHSMCNSLLISQFLRLLKNSDKKSLFLVAYWNGDSFCDLLPGLNFSPRLTIIPEYFSYIESLLIVSKTSGLITGSNWRHITNRMLYKDKASSFPIPKIELDIGYSYRNAWFFLNLPVFSSSDRDILYLVVHNKLPVRERLFRIGLNNDPYCDICCHAPICDTVHFFCSCVRVGEVWKIIRAHLLLWNMDISDSQLINFTFPRGANEKAAVWLLGHYIAKVWVDLSKRAVDQLNSKEFFGYLQFKYRADKIGTWNQLRGLLQL